jgi:hypothetical protein
MSESNKPPAGGECEQVTRAMVAVGMLNRSQTEGRAVKDLESEVIKIFLAMRAIERFEGSAPHLHDNEDNAYLLWAEIHRLRWETKGPEGFKNWRDAAIHERHLRVKAEREAARLSSEASGKAATAVAITENQAITSLDASTASILDALHAAGSPLYNDDGKALSVEERIHWLGAKAGMLR